MIDSPTPLYLIHEVQLNPGPPLAFGGIGASPANFRMKPEVPQRLAMILALDEVDTIAFDD